MASDQLRVLFIVSGLGQGGAEAALERLLPALSAQRLACQVLSLGALGVVGERLREAGVVVHTLGMSPSRPSLRALWGLWRIVRQFRPHILQGWMYHGNVAAHLARLARPSAKVVLAIHQTLARPELDSRATRAVIRVDAWLSRFASRSIYVAESARSQHLAVGYTSRGADVIPNGMDTQTFAPDSRVRQSMRAQLSLRDAHFVIGNVGRFHPVKDHANFLRAAALVAEQYDFVRFVLVGAEVTPDNPALQPLFDVPALIGKVQCLGLRSDVAALFQAFDLHVLASLSEGLPNVVAEAMSCGIPSVVTDVGDAARMVANSGWVVAPGDAERLAAGMVEAVSCLPADFIEKSILARCLAEAHYAIAAVAMQYFARYQAVICYKND